jgi:hypothetical protein
MKHRLVLQWPKSSLAQYNPLLETEELLLKHLTSHGEVDGHDFGSDEANIFILTDDPEVLFAEVKAILSNTPYWANARVAYRPNESDEYKILWPKNLTEFKVT